MVFALISAVSAWCAWRYFPEAIPLIKLDVKMTREQALEQASAVAEKLHLVAPSARKAVLFAHDGATQNYVELEAGGKSGFADMLSGTLYAPYWWEVRLFHAGETAEADVRFRPDGSPYGFTHKIPETLAGATLDAAAAQNIAETRARADWGVDFAPYKLLEHSQEQRPSGRIDHSFVYERTKEKLGDGHYRLRLGVAGDELVELTHFVNIPEAFQRRFQELRFANNTIAQVASMVAGALYGIGGCILGVLWLLKKRALLWKPALIAGAVVSALNALAVLANSSQAWFGFDTAQSPTIFWAQQLGLAILICLGGAIALGLVFMAAESLSRRAFPQHPQLWQIWSPAAAPTTEILGRTVGGYLFVPIELALIAGFYFITNRYFGWWQPSESLTDPNILGTALPALGPIGAALQAGFMEECLFRAVPLSIAALIGARFGHRTVFIGLALVLQAIVFGAAHANYPGFPSYSRLVELVGPAFVWGLIFLRFGLLPTIILHATFDLVLMSIPVFLIDGTGSLLNQLLVVVAGLVPLGVVIARRLRAGTWTTLAANLRNAAWLPDAQTERADSIHGRAAAGAWTARVRTALPLLGLAGLAAVVVAGDVHRDVPPLTIDRPQAIAAAESALKDRGVALGPEWRRSAATRLVGDDGSGALWHKFVWREGGPEAYAALIGTWLAPPLWEVRYARFEGVDVAERAEEWRVTVAGDGNVRQIRHQLPEMRPGAKLSREQARAKAQREIALRFGLDASALREISAVEQEHPARSDWQFTYADPRVNVGKGGEARVGVVIAGDEIASAGRLVFVPEDWQRTERERAGRLSIVKNVVWLTIIVIAIAALIAAIVAWNRGQFDKRAFAWTLILSGASAIIGAINAWPSFAMQLRTFEPLLPQIALRAASVGIAAIPMALLASLLAGVAAWAARAHVPAGSARQLWSRAVSAGLLVAGVKALASAVGPKMFPRWPGYGIENAWVPWLQAAVGPVGGLLLQFAVTIIALYWIERFTDGWQRRRWLAFALLSIGIGVLAAATADEWVPAAITGLAVGALYTMLFATVLRFDLRLVPAFAATQGIVAIVGDALLKGTAAGALYALLQIVTTLVLAWLATQYLLRSGELGRRTAPTAAS